jgi:tetratricopeptide (TPR) repeat protein
MVSKKIDLSQTHLPVRETAEDARKHYEEGVAFYTRSEPYDPLDYEQKQNQRLKLAVESFKRAISLKPDYYDAYLHLGYSYDGLKNYGLALEAYKEAARLKPSDYTPYYMIGQTYYAFHRYGEAITFYLEAEDIYRNSVGEPHAGIIESLGVAYLESGDRKSALAQYRILKKMCRQRDGKGVIDYFEYLLRKG